MWLFFPVAHCCLMPSAVHCVLGKRTVGAAGDELGPEFGSLSSPQSPGWLMAKALLCFEHTLGSVQGLCVPRVSTEAVGTGAFRGFSFVLGSCARVPGLCSVVSYRDKMLSCPQLDLSLAVLDHFEPVWSFWRKDSCSSQEAYYTVSDLLCAFYKQQPGVLNLIINYKTQWLKAARFIII